MCVAWDLHDDDGVGWNAKERKNIIRILTELERTEGSRVVSSCGQNTYFMLLGGGDLKCYVTAPILTRLART